VGHRNGCHRRDDAGQVVLWMIMVVGTLTAVGLIAMRIGELVVNEARVQAAADATALALAAGDRLTMVGDVLDGYELVTVRRSGNEVEVLVGDGRTTAVARARLEHMTTRRRSGLAPSMVAALARAEQLLGYRIVVVSGYRSTEQQQALWDRRHLNPYPVAPPGRSLHQQGLAIDVRLDQVGELARIAAAAGLCHPLPESDPVHFVVCPIPE